MLIFFCLLLLDRLCDTPHVLMYKFCYVCAQIPFLSEPVSGVETDESSEHPEEDREQEQEAEEERESEPVDLSQFEPDVLPVSCDTVTGDLYKNRFAGGSSEPQS